MTTQQPDALQCAADLEYSIARHGMQDAFTLNAYRAMKMVRTQLARITELESQLARRFDAEDMATAAAQGFRDGGASLSANAGEPSGHIKEPYTLAEIKAKIASNDYSAEMLLQHAMLLLGSVQEDAARYRWLRRWKGQEHEPPCTVQHEIDGTLWGGDLDAAIDAARKQGARWQSAVRALTLHI